jgi:hypothetical protein
LRVTKNGLTSWIFQALSHWVLPAWPALFQANVPG